MERAAASWWRGRRRGGEASGLEAWRFQCDRGRLRGREWREWRRRGGGGDVVVEGGEVWLRRQYMGFQCEREREREEFVICIFNFIYLTNLIV